MNRNELARLGQETVDILQRGWYASDGGRRVELASAIERMNAKTRLYAPQELSDLVRQAERSDIPRRHSTAIEVVNETTLAAAHRHVVQRGRSAVTCLNFASAHQPGGGFLSGCTAQEESLARSSGLYVSLVLQPRFYEENRCSDTALYTDFMIYSPEVPVFRDDAGKLLDEPYVVDMLTSPAANVRELRVYEPDRMPLVGPTMAVRLSMMLALAASQGCEHLILGAWGCGAFGGDPHQMARLMADRLLGGGPFSDRFSTVTLAVYDTSPGEQTIGAFRRWFAPAGVQSSSSREVQSP
jgi:uncharacterized protein (TIGR02452 family)